MSGTVPFVVTVEGATGDNDEVTISTADGVLNWFKQTLVAGVALSTLAATVIMESPWIRLSAIVNHPQAVNIVVDADVKDITRSISFPGIRSSASVVLQDIYTLCALRMSDAAIDLVFDEINANLSAGKFAACNELLTDVSLSDLTPPVMLSFLAITRAARDKLASRTMLIDRIRDELNSSGSTKDIEKILKRLA